ncbi:MAG: type II toxin-antitoxin system HipA family toxin [Alphaproteobacteria bacterium]|nr:type II toxin-antitoxin system HipA family toxin [Alphaproteobacteria bacterium]
MTSSAQRDATEAYVWVWLPGHTAPVVAGRLDKDGPRLLFTYGASYRKRDDAIPLYEPELPLRAGLIEPLNGLDMPGCLRDGAPDAWGRRIITQRIAARTQDTRKVEEIGELTFLLESGSDRAGALDFQHSATEYVPRGMDDASLVELQEAAEHIERGLPVSQTLDRVLNHSSSVGGARPKAAIQDKDRKLIAKFASTTDIYSVVKAEFIAMRLAAACGLDTAAVSLTQAAGKDVLLVQRFDRLRTEEGWLRRAMVSALTMLHLDELMARYASYEDLAELIRHRFDRPKDTLRELFGRLCFNILCGNTDDHARNHAAFWNGQTLSLTPAYDICPQGRTGGEATQAMLIKGGNRYSTLAACMSAAPDCLLNDEQAAEIITAQITTLAENWRSVCEDAALSPADRALLAGRQFLNPFCLEGLPTTHGALRRTFEYARASIIG